MAKFLTIDQAKSVLAQLKSGAHERKMHIIVTVRIGENDYENMFCTFGVGDEPAIIIHGGISKYAPIMCQKLDALANETYNTVEQFKAAYGLEDFE